MKKLKIIFFALWLIGISCNDQNQVIKENLLKATKVYDLNIAEPSGLAYAGNGVLYIVSDNTAKVYRISSTGEILETLKYYGNDLEAIALDLEKQFIYVANEKLATICKLSLTGDLLETHIVDLTYTDKNSGIEGLAINKTNKTLLALNEKNPGLILEYDESFHLIRKIQLDLASDYSDICILEQRQEIWILSDEEQKIMRCDLNGNLLDEYIINVYQPEGLAIDEKNETIYIASDAYEKLYHYKMPDIN
jgi:uncharacterized protein YjiK